jgi:hypothetical protein
MTTSTAARETTRCERDQPTPPSTAVATPTTPTAEAGTRDTAKRCEIAAGIP